jgi:hypothetical protein
MSADKNDIPGIVKPPPVDTPATVAGLTVKLTGARAEAAALKEKADALLARFKGQGGKHGSKPEQERRQAVMLRIPGDTITRIDGIARAIGSTRAGTISMLVTAASNVPPARWFEALAALPRR